MSLNEDSISACRAEGTLNMDALEDLDFDTEDLENLELISSTDIKCVWSTQKGVTKEKYKPVSINKMPCLMNKIPHCDVITDDDSIRIFFCESLPNSAISEHRIEDMPWAQVLWKKIERHSKKGFLNWCKIVKQVAGNKEDNVTTWNNEYLKSVDEVFCDMVAEMSRIHLSTINNMQEFFNRLEKACIELHQPIPQIKDEGLSLYEAQQQLLKFVKEYEIIINAKKQRLDHLNKKQIQLCKELDQNLQIDLKYPPLPTEAQFDNFTKYIDKLQAEKFEREEKFINFKHEITEIVNEIKYKPNSDFERQVLSSDLRLSNENLKKLEFFLKCLKELKISTEEEVSHLRTRIEDLWKMLDIELIDRDEFRTHYTGSSLETLEALKVEVKKCEEKRKANIKKFVDKLRDQLQNIWKKCHCSESDKKSFRYFANDFYTEDLLDLHELEIQKWKQFYEDNSKLLDIIKKHQELWDKMIQFEENATGANRFKNRGGQLLQEEKERNKLSKLIPQLEEQMLNLSDAFLNKNGRIFTTFGSTIEEYIQRLHEARENDRKTKLSARKLQRIETTVRTPCKSSACLFPPSTSRCTTVTPKTLASASKRKILATPNTENTPKRPRANNTPVTVGSRAKCTPRVIPKIKVTHATMSLPKQRRSRSFQEKQKRKRALRQSRGAQNENAVSDPNETRETTYSEFQSNLSSRGKSTRSTILPIEATPATPSNATKKTPKKTPTFKTPSRTPASAKTPSSRTPTGSKNETKLAVCKSNLKLLF